jgi:hypothetical protein
MRSCVRCTGVVGTRVAVWAPTALDSVVHGYMNVCMWLEVDREAAGLNQLHLRRKTLIFDGVGSLFVSTRRRAICSMFSKNIHYYKKNIYTDRGFNFSNKYLMICFYGGSLVMSLNHPSLL